MRMGEIPFQGQTRQGVNFLFHSRKILLKRCRRWWWRSLSLTRSYIYVDVMLLLNESWMHGRVDTLSSIHLLEHNPENMFTHIVWYSIKVSSYNNNSAFIDIFCTQRVVHICNVIHSLTFPSIKASSCAHGAKCERQQKCASSLFIVSEYYRICEKAHISCFFTLSSDFHHHDLWYMLELVLSSISMCVQHTSIHFCASESFLLNKHKIPKRRTSADTHEIMMPPRDWLFII